MAKAIRGRPRKAIARKTPAPVKRQVAKPGVTSDKIRALVYNLSAQELEELINVATGRKNEEMANARASFLGEVKARAATLGISLADLAGLGGRKQAGGTKATRSAAVAKYRNSKTGETWSGRGRPPRWISDLEAKGRKRQEFAV
jgi:DNA-binding protein H-NS